MAFLRLAGGGENDLFFYGCMAAVEEHPCCSRTFDDVDGRCSGLGLVGTYAGLILFLERGPKFFVGPVVKLVEDVAVCCI
jgi:hypothetical protein